MANRCAPVMQRLALIAFSTALLAASADAAYPVPVIRDTTGFGSKIPRTMSLIATSTARHRNTVRIQVYGQSWEKQEWSQQVATGLKATWPNVDFVFKNNAMGGFASEQLLRPSYNDIHPFYPDLLIFHVGMMSQWSLDSIIAGARRRTATELMMYNGFYPTGSTGEASYFKNTLAPRYHGELVDAYQQFQDYLADNNLAGTAVSDGHLTPQGNFVLAELVKAHFRYRPQSAADPDSLVWTYHVGTDASFTNGKLTLPFCGNRVDLIVANPAPAGAPRAKVLIDSKPPSQFPGCYAITRPNGDKGQDWINGPVLPDKSDSLDWPWNPGAVTCVQWNNPLVLEKWTARLTNINRAPNKPTFNFAMTGSVTGADGSGTGAQNFTSPSGRVVITTADWFIPNNAWPYQVSVPEGFLVTWQVIPQFIDTFTAPATGDPAKEYAVTVAQGLPNASHTLELTALGNGSVPVTAIRIYRPWWNRPSCAVPPPRPVSIERPVRGAIQRIGTGAAIHRMYSLTGRLAAVLPQGKTVLSGGRSIRGNGVYLDRTSSGSRSEAVRVVSVN